VVLGIFRGNAILEGQLIPGTDWYEKKKRVFKSRVVWRVCGYKGRQQMENSM
jgi:hypothetical protein